MRPRAPRRPAVAVARAWLPLLQPSPLPLGHPAVGCRACPRLALSGRASTAALRRPRTRAPPRTSAAAAVVPVA